MKRQILISSLILLFIQTLAVAGDTYYVPSRDYPTIQSAITAALNGDEVVVVPGVYSGYNNVDLDFNGKAITVRSQIDPNNPNWDIIASTIIDCQGNKYEPHRAFYFRNGEGTDSKVLGFTIINGYGRGPKSVDGRFAADPPVPYESIDPEDPNGIPRAERGRDASGDGYGGAILCAGASPTIQYCVISNCTVTGGQGGDGAFGQWGEWTYQPPDPNIEPIDVLDGQWGGYGGIGSGNGYGGAIACLAGSSPLISDCIIKDNSAQGGRGGDGGDGGYAAEDPDYSDGYASHGGDAGDSYGDGIGGGIYSENTSTPIIVNCTFSNNIAMTGARAVGGLVGEGNPLPEGQGGPATDGAIGFVYSFGGIAGGAAYYHHSDADFTNCTFTENKAFEANPSYDTLYDREYDPAYTIGGALYSDAFNTVNLNTCGFTGNLGGAVYCRKGCNLEVKNSSFMENADPNDGMDLWSFVWPPIDFGSGGAIYAGIEGYVLIQDSDFGFNSAKNNGGALKSESDISLNKCSFNRNIAESGYGGASDVYRSGAPLIIDVNNCSFIGNQSVYGGGLSTENFTAEFVNCYFIGNEAERGGALNLAIGSVNIIGGFVKSNKATNGYGGGLNCYATEADISHCTIMDNFAGGVYPTGGGGGGIYFYGLTSLHRLFNCLVVGNSATFDGGAINSYNAEPEIGNCTFDDNFAGGYGGAVFSGWGSDVQITDSTFRNNSSHAIHEQFPSGEAAVTYSLFYNNPDGDYYDSGTGMTYSGSGQIGLIPGGSNNLYNDPRFVTGDLGDYYLSQIAAGQGSNSPAVNGGSGTAASLGLDMFTTRTDNVVDSGQVDIGYHYFDSTEVGYFQLTASVVGGHGIVEPTSGTYYAGTVVTLTAEPDIGWRVKAWSGTDDDSSVETTNSIVMNSDRVVTVEFEQPRTLIVSLGGGQQGYYNNIQDAIQNARDGDTVVVQPGIYYGGNYNIMAYIDKSITVRSVHPDDPSCVASTIIDGYQGPPFSDWSINGVWFGPNADAETILNGFTIRNCGGFIPASDDGDRPAGHPDGYDGGCGEGPAILIYPGAGPVVKNCVITDNLIVAGDAGNGVNAILTAHAGRGGWPGWAHGGAVYCGPNSTPTFINCQIINNLATGGNGGNGGNQVIPGGFENYGGSWSMLGTPEYPAVYYDPFSLDQLSITDGYLWELWEWDEAAVYWSVYFGADPERTSYFGNYRWYSGFGGGAYCDIGSEVSFIDCVISGNVAQGGMSGQGGFSVGGRPTDPIIPYEIPSFGGGVYCAAESTVNFSGCIITDNNSTEPNEINHRIDLYMGHGGGVCAEDTATVIFTDCIISGNEAAAGGGLHFADANLVMSDCGILSNTGYHGGGLFGEHGQATIYRCDISGNAALEDLNEPNDTQGEGGGLHLWATEADIIDCNISNNQSEASGGGVFFGGEGEPTLTNCLITNNTAGRDGGGVSVSIFAQLTISNCTIADNTLTGEGFDNSYGGGVYVSYDSYTNIIDSILWGNSAEIGSQLSIGTGFEYSQEPSMVDVSYSDVRGGESSVFVDEDCILNWGAGNISSGPLFVTGPMGDYYLSQIASGQPAESDCVNAGSDTAANLGMDSYTTSTTEMPDRNIVDMGYHYPFTTDVEPCKSCDLFGDGIIDFKDFAVFSLSWLNEGCSAANDWCQHADFTFDSYVDFEDVQYLAECWLAEDTKPPVPNPSEWAITPYSSSSSTISMAAVPSFDVWSPTIEYYFDCFSGGGNDSGWQEDSSYTDSGLVLGQEYSYRVKACDVRGNETGWSVIRYVVLGEQPIPDEPGNLTAVAVSASQIDLNWTDNSYDEDGFSIERRTGAEAFAEIATVGPGITAYQDTGLQYSTTYTYQVCAYNTGGNSPYSNEASAMTFIAYEPNEPNIIVGDEDPNCGQYSDGIYWYHLVVGEVPDLGVEPEVWFRFECVSAPELSSDWVDAAGVFPHPVEPGWPDVEITVDGQIVTYTIAVMEGGAWGRELDWRVCASYNAYGEAESCSEIITITNAPTDLTAQAVSTSQIDLNWTDNSYNEDGFSIERRTGAEVFAEIATVGPGITAYQDTGLQYSTTYTYQVCAYSAGGDSPYSNEVSETTFPIYEPNEPSMIVGDEDPSSTQYSEGVYWYHLVVAEVPDLGVEPLLWFRFVCVSAPEFSSDWIDSTGVFPQVLPHPVAPGFPAVEITLDGQIVTYTIAVKEGGTWGASREWSVCASYNADGAVESCSGTITIPSPP